VADSATATLGAVGVPAARFTLVAGDLIAGIAILASITLLAATQAREGIALVAVVGIGLLAQKVLRRDLSATRT
jgi:hypothetical protein